jgi:hypothetical protein
MKTFLGGADMVFFFNNNQLNRTEGENSLAVWAQLCITDANGTLVGNYFDFSNRMSPYALVSGGGGGVPLGDPTTYTAGGRSAPGYDPLTGNTDYVLSGGPICLSAAFALVSCDGPYPYGPFNHNLGAENAAYAVIFPELNALMASLFADATLDLTELTLHMALLKNEWVNRHAD